MKLSVLLRFKFKLSLLKQFTVFSSFFQDSFLVCYTPLDNVGQQGNTECVQYLVAVTAPELIPSTSPGGSLVCIYYFKRSTLYLY